MTYQPDKLERLVALLEQHTSREGIEMTGFEDLGTFRSSITQVRTPNYYEPAIVIVGQGKKRCFVGDKTYEYGTGDYLILFLPMSLNVEIIEASPEKPFLAAGVRIDLGRLAGRITADRTGRRCYHPTCFYRSLWYIFGAVE